MKHTRNTMLAFALAALAPLALANSESPTDQTAEPDATPTSGGNPAPAPEPARRLSKRRLPPRSRMKRPC